MRETGFVIAQINKWVMVRYLSLGSTCWVPSNGYIIFDNIMGIIMGLMGVLF